MIGKYVGKFWIEKKLLTEWKEEEHMMVYTMEEKAILHCELWDT